MAAAAADVETRVFRLDRCGDLAPLRGALERAGYTEATVAELVLTNESGKPLQTAALLRRTADPSPLNTLVRLFVLARPVAEAQVGAVVAPASVSSLCEAGLLRRHEQGVRATVAMMPSEELMLVRDFWPGFSGDPVAFDYVPGMAPVSRAVGNLTVRRRGETALDLGTGSGVQALFAAPHTERVIATDTNLRALNFAAFNARLNGISNIELRRGNLFEPVAEERFDLIVSNPPFVISPEKEVEYRDGGLPGDRLTEQVIRGAAGLLREGGYATVMGNWCHEDEDAWADPPRRWLASRGCDVLIVGSDTKDPLSYASAWLSEAEDEFPGRCAQRLDQWLAYYERLGIRRITSGAVIFRRRSEGPNWVRAENRSGEQLRGSASEQIQRVFAAQDFLALNADPRHLLDTAFALTGDHQLEHLMRACGGRWNVEAARLLQTRGFPSVGNVDRLVCTLLAGCDGRRRLGELVADLARSLGVETERVAEGSVNAIRKLFEAGFLTVAGTPTP